MVTPFTRRAILLCTAVLAGTGMAVSALAQEPFPSKPIKILVPFPPGGATDQLARLMATRLSTSTGQSVIVENKPGAGGLIASEFIAKQPADGYTVMIISSSLASTPAVVANPSVDAQDFTPIALLGKMVVVLAGSPKAPGKNVQELFSYMKSNPGKLNYAVYGQASASNIAMLHMQQRAGVHAPAIVYKGSSQAMPDLISGRVELVMDAMSSSAPFIASGQLKAYAITNAQRTPLAPDIPTLAESGLPGYQYEPWFGVFGPPKMPAAVVARLNREFNAAIQDTEAVQALQKQFITPTPISPDQFRSLFRNEIEHWKTTARTVGIKPE